MTTAFVFPGQGSQSVGMQAGLAADHAVVRETYEEASDLLGFVMFALVQDGPKETLDETANTQPAMLTAGVATWRAWQQAGGAAPAMLAGHSLGEYSALVAASAIDFAAAIVLVKQRAELMQNAVPAGEGAMAAILGLKDEEILDICADASGVGVAEAVNFNSPGQVVVAGHRDAIARLIELAKSAGARRAIMLAVSVPSHSSLMHAAGTALGDIIDEVAFSAPELPVICAVDGLPYGDAGDTRQRIKRQVYSPVQWVRTISHMTDAGVSSVIECGPGKVLAGLVRRIDRNIHTLCIDSTETLETALHGASE